MHGITSGGFDGAVLPAAVIVVTMVLACGGGGPVAALSRPEPVAQPRMVIGDTQVNHACAGFFSSCSRASCIVINAGDAGGPVNVELTVKSGSGQEQSHGESLFLDPSARKTVSYDFNGFNAVTVECTTR